MPEPTLEGVSMKLSGRFQEGFFKTPFGHATSMQRSEASGMPLACRRVRFQRNLKTSGMSQTCRRVTLKGVPQALSKCCKMQQILTGTFTKEGVFQENAEFSSAGGNFPEFWKTPSKKKKLDN